MKPFFEATKMCIYEVAKGNLGLGGCGGVMRDQYGRILLGVALPLRYQTNHLVEAVATDHGVLLARNSKVNYVWMEGDSNKIIQCLLGKQKLSWNIRTWIEKTREISLSF